MPEYLAPGVYVEETSYRSKSIEGVSTSTAAFVGPTRYGPVTGDPEIITSLSEFIRIYGDLDDLNFTTGTAINRTNYLAHAVRAFFEEGGKRLFVGRVFHAGVNGFDLRSMNGTDNIPSGFYGRANIITHNIKWQETLAIQAQQQANNAFAIVSQETGVAYLIKAVDAGKGIRGLVEVLQDLITAATEETDIAQKKTLLIDAIPKAELLEGANNMFNASKLALEAVDGDPSLLSVFETAISEAEAYSASFEATVNGAANNDELNNLAAELAGKFEDVHSSANEAARTVEQALTINSSVNVSSTGAKTAAQNVIKNSVIVPKQLEVVIDALELAKSLADGASDADAAISTAQAVLDAQLPTIEEASNEFEAAIAIDMYVDAAAKAHEAADAIKTGIESALADDGFTKLSAEIETTFDADGSPMPFIVARFPGAMGNMRIHFTLKVGSNVLNNGTPQRVKSGDVVHLSVANEKIPSPGINTDGLYIIYQNPNTGEWSLTGQTPAPDLSDLADLQLCPLTVVVDIEFPNATNTRYGNQQLFGEYTIHHSSDRPLTATFTRNPALRREALTIPFAFEGTQGGTDQEAAALDFLRRLFSLSLTVDEPINSNGYSADYVLSNGSDGDVPIDGNYEGTNPLQDYENDPLRAEKYGLSAIQAIEDISIVAAPGSSARTDESQARDIQGRLLAHCEKLRYRVAVLDTPPNYTITQALAYRNQKSSTHGALYFPWITVSDPVQGGPLSLPPSGFIAGIYARNDIQRDVFKAPANEVIRLALDFEQRVNTAQQELLNPEGVNCLRFFEGRGYLVWGARTISDDPEWKYVSVRRYFAYMERSIDQGTQWAVFENNGPRLWDNVRRTIEDFLYNEWQRGGLLGDKPEKAYFVRCDRSTMTQNDLDNGRLVCLIGVAPVKPAEFVIFRIGQWTADSNR